MTYPKQQQMSVWSCLKRRQHWFQPYYSRTCYWKRKPVLLKQYLHTSNGGSPLGTLRWSRTRTVPRSHSTLLAGSSSLPSSSLQTQHHHLNDKLSKCQLLFTYFVSHCPYFHEFHRNENLQIYVQYLYSIVIQLTYSKICKFKYTQFFSKFAEVYTRENIYIYSI